MTTTKELFEHPFSKLIIDDNLIDKKTTTELEIYRNNSMFYSVHFFSLLMQLENAVELFSKYNYTKNDNIGRGFHLTYNYENYLIRIVSLSDRLLQTINAIYDLGIDEKDVKERLIFNNAKVKKTEIEAKYKIFNKTISEFIGNRNQIIHRHSLITDEISRLEKLYHPVLTESYLIGKSEDVIQSFKYIRKIELTKFIKETKSKFKIKNTEIYYSLIPIFDILLQKYEENKKNIA